MPTYQYVCGACQAPLEIVQSFSEDALVNCPACGAPELRKVYGSVGVVFKGSGFYRTDSRSASTAATPATPATPSATPAATPSAEKSAPTNSSSTNTST